MDHLPSAALAGAADLVPTGPPSAFRELVEAGRDADARELLAAAEQLGPDPRFAALDDAEVVRQLGTAASVVAAATGRYLALLAELVVRGVWADQGARTPAVWLAWKLGVAPSTAREQLRVALRLRELPRVAERLADGTLSYSKARAITRIARDTDEDLLLRWADHGTAADLDRIASATRSARRRAEVDPFAEDPGPADHRWHLRSHHDGTATLTIVGPVEDLLRLDDEVARLAEADRRDREGHRHDEGDDRTGDATSSDERAAPPVQLTAEDRVSALSHVVAAAAASATPTDSSGLDGHTLVLQLQASDLAGEDGDEHATAIVAVADTHRRVGAMHRSVLRRLACEAGVVTAVRDGGGVLDVGRRTRRPSAALRRAVHLRDRGRCAFPGCDATRHLHVHHVVHWADGGPTDLSNLVTLCGHHHRHVHATDAVIEVHDDGHHRIRAGADGDIIEHSPRLSGVPTVADGASAEAPEVPGAPAAGIPAASGASAGAAAAQVEVRGGADPNGASAEALAPGGYDGGPFDLDLAVAILLTRRGRDEAVLAA